MAKTDFASVDQYLSLQPEASREVLALVRGSIRKALPKAEEVISYQIPAYKVAGEGVLYFAGWKKHFSLYPAGPELLAAFEGELKPYEIKKATIRFPLGAAVPTKLIERIAKFRAKEVAARAKAKVAGDKGR